MFNPLKIAEHSFNVQSRVGDRTTYQTEDGKLFTSYSRSPLGVAYDAYKQGAVKNDPFADSAIRARGF